MYNSVFEKINIQRFVRYCLVGLLNTVLYTITLGYLLKKQFFDLSVSTLIALFISIVFQFNMNKKFTFNSNYFSKSEIIKYSIMIFINYILSLVCLKLLIDFYKFQMQYALFVNIFVLTTTGFLMSNYWVFKKNE